MSIEIAHLGKAYGKKRVLDDFSASLLDGEVTVIMGASGCGKTTLLRILMGLEQADTGKITGRPDRFSAVFQEDRLCEELTALENVLLVGGPMPGKGFSRGNRQERLELEARDLLAKLGLGDSLFVRVSELSGGMKRRVAIARALFAKAPVIVMDEPFKGLDAATKERVMEIVREACKGRTLLLVTHEKTEADFFGGRCIRM